MAVRAELGIPFPDPIAAVTAAQVDAIVDHGPRRAAGGR